MAALWCVTTIGVALVIYFLPATPADRAAVTSLESNEWLLLCVLLGMFALFVSPFIAAWGAAMTVGYALSAGRRNARDILSTEHYTTLLAIPISALLITVTLAVAPVMAVEYPDARIQIVAFAVSAICAAAILIYAFAFAVGRERQGARPLSLFDPAWLLLPQADFSAALAQQNKRLLDRRCLFAHQRRKAAIRQLCNGSTSRGLVDYSQRHRGNERAWAFVIGIAIAAAVCATTAVWMFASLPDRPSTPSLLAMALSGPLALLTTTFAHVYEEQGTAYKISRARTLYDQRDKERRKEDADSREELVYALMAHMKSELSPAPAHPSKRIRLSQRWHLVRDSPTKTAEPPGIDMTRNT
jgi:hypothetical protein